MPKVHDYKKNKKSHHGEKSHKAKKSTEETYEEGDIGNKVEEDRAESAKRRPGRDEAVEYVDTIDESADHASHAEETLNADADEVKTEPEDFIRINFPGSDILRAQVPEVFQAAESIATEWQKNGDFENIDVPNPLLKQAATMGLQKAKQVEKKLEEKGVFLVAKMGLEMVKAKLKK